MALHTEGVGGRARLPLLYRAAAGARRALGGRGTRLMYGSRLAGPLRRALTRGAPHGMRLVEICGGRNAGVLMHIDLASEKYYWLGTHEEEAQALLASAVRDGDVVYDVGAHAGFFTLLCARLAGTAGRVQAFEPEPANCERLAANVAANGLTNVVVTRAAISDAEGEESFARGATSLEGRLTYADDASAERVRTTTIDTMVAAGAPPPEMIKIDVEGAEARVLRGAWTTLRRHRPRLLIEVHSAAAGQEVAALLDGAYAFFDIARGSAVARPLPPGHYDARPEQA